MRNRIRTLSEQVQKIKGRKEAIETRAEELKQELRFLNIQESRHERALEIVKQVGLQTQKQLEYRLSEQVSLALATVFEDPYELCLEFVERRGKTEADILYKRRGLKMRPFGSVGGGAIDIGAFALRVAYLTMRQDKHIRSCLILDEPFQGLKGYDQNRNALQLLLQVSHNKTRPIQIISVSDERIPREDIIEFSDKTILVTQKMGKSKVKILKGNEVI